MIALSTASHTQAQEPRDAAPVTDPVVDPVAEPEEIPMEVPECGSTAVHESSQLTQLILQQNELIRQLQVSHAGGPKEPDDLKSFFIKLPAEFKSSAREWEQHVRSVAGHLATQESLSAKYKRLQEAGELCTQLQDDAKKGWQWPKSYKAIATSVSFDVNTSATAEAMLQDYDIDEAWKALRLQHARQCQTFIFTHAQRCLAHYRSECNPEKLLENLSDRLRSFIATHEWCFSKEAIGRLRMHTRSYGEAVLRVELPKAKSKIQKANAQAEKKQKALLESETAFRQMDVKELLGLALVEMQGPRSAKEQRSPKDGSVMNYLLKEHPSILKDLKPKAGRGRSTSRGKPKASAKSKARAKSKSQSQKRSSSRVSFSNLSPRSSERGQSSRSRNSSSKSKGKGRGKGRKGAGKGKAASRKKPKPNTNSY